MNDILQTLHAWLTDYQKLEILGSIVGLIYIYQEIKASIWLWLTGIIMPAIYIFVYLEAGLYADFGMQVYYILAGIYGFAVWKWGKTRPNGHGKVQEEARKELPISHLPHRYYLPCAVVFLLLWAVLYLILAHLTNSTVPLYDSFGNALSIIGLWALAKKYIEQWLVWIVVDAELAALYAYKDIPFTAGLYALYAILAIVGYLKWQKEYHKTKEGIEQNE